MKGRLASSFPSDLQHLEEDLQQGFRSLMQSQDWSRGCVQQSELPFSLCLIIELHMQESIGLQFFRGSCVSSFKG
jgi:hypothetical protein